MIVQVTDKRRSKQIVYVLLQILEDDLNIEVKEYKGVQKVNVFKNNIEF